MATAKPIVATSVGGVPEAITSGQNGLLVGADDAKALAAGIGRLIDDRALGERLAAAARATMEARFRAGDVVGRYAEVYHRLLGQCRGKRDSLAATT
jgi:glycosyltransferase involved in cell wall biosynthesis